MRFDISYRVKATQKPYQVLVPQKLEKAFMLRKLSGFALIWLYMIRILSTDVAFKASVELINKLYSNVYKLDFSPSQLSEYIVQWSH